TMLRGKGGMVAYLGTNDMRQTKQRIQQGDKEAELVYRAMAYQVAREIGLLAAVLKGKVDGIALTGGLAYDDDFVGLIEEFVGWIAKVYVFPGEEEMEALAQGALRVLTGEEKAKIYAPENK
ncbi:butyrate kinase, partial [bacterium]